MTTRMLGEELQVGISACSFCNCNRHIHSRQVELCTKTHVLLTVLVIVTRYFVPYANSWVSLLLKEHPQRLKSLNCFASSRRDAIFETHLTNRLKPLSLQERLLHGVHCGVLLALHPFCCGSSRRIPRDVQRRSIPTSSPLKIVIA